MYKLLNELYDNEVSYTHLLYDDIGLTEDVLTMFVIMVIRLYLT